MYRNWRRPAVLCPEWFLPLPLPVCPPPYCTSPRTMYCPSSTVLQLDWSDFSVHVPESDIPRMHEVLEGVSDTQLKQYQVRQQGHCRGRGDGNI